MKYFIPIKTIVNDSDIGEYENADGTFNIAWTKDTIVSGAGVIRQYDKKIYKSLGQIKQLVTYIWQDNDPLNKTALKTSDDSVTDGKAIPLVSGVTTVYVMSLSKYYKAKHTGTIDFTLESEISPTHFDEVTNNSLRYEYYTPSLTPALWEDLGVANRYASESDAINKSSSKNATSFYKEYIISKFDTVLLYNMKCSSAKIEYRMETTDQLLYEKEYLGETLDFTSFREWFNSSLQENSYNDKILDRPDFFYLGNVKVKITLTNSYERPSLGGFYAGILSDGGLTLDNVSNPTETDCEIKKLENGELIFDGENDPSRVWRNMVLNIKVPSSSYNEYNKMTLDIVGKKIVVIGENVEENPIYSSLILYGGTTRADITLTESNTYSNLSVNFREFTQGT